MANLKGFTRSDVMPKVTKRGLPRASVVRRFIKLRKAGFNPNDADSIARSAKGTRLALSIARKARR